jgi:hypothetical protein
MNITLAIGPLVSVIAGILILIVPRLLNYIVALYLIIIGLLGIFGAGNYRLQGTQAQHELPAATSNARPVAPPAFLPDRASGQHSLI